ncbi:MAG: 2-hydroxyacyl-CoA dehydratase [Chloroflexi bacterium]|nr:2-hydroxyacyl-CoA dehydratase [Chloroflexota bacterium]
MKQLVDRRYETRPVENWNKCRELRQQYYKDVASAKEQGKLLIGGSTGGLNILAQGLKNIVWFGGETYAATVSADPAFCYPCLEATEAEGFGRDTCVYFRNYFGSMLLDKYYFGGPFPKPDLFLQSHICDVQGKSYQAISQYMGKPYFCVDQPPGPPDEKRTEERIKYYAGQLLDAIEWLEKTTGREYDDERFARAAANDWEASRLWAETCLLNQNIPAPLDQKSMLTLFLPLMVLRGDDRSVEFCKELKAEVEERVRDGIAALATERYRYIHEGIPPWHFLRLFRILEEYGAVSVGSLYMFGMAGYWDIGDDGIWRPQRPFKDLGVELKSREDIASFYARVYLSNINYRGSFYSAANKNMQVLQIYQQWRSNGVVMHLNRGCKGTGGYMLENRLALIEAGIPVVSYEGNAADRRDFDEAQVIDRIESFAESQGLTKIPAPKG